MHLVVGCFPPKHPPNAFVAFDAKWATSINILDAATNAKLTVAMVRSSAAKLASPLTVLPLPERGAASHQQLLTTSNCLEAALCAMAMAAMALANEMHCQKVAEHAASDAAMDRPNATKQACFAPDVDCFGGGGPC